MKYAWIDTHRAAFALNELCAVLEVSVSGYRAWKRGGTPDRQGLTDAHQRLALIQSIHAELKGAYGSPRMVRERRARGFPVSKARVERLMREHGLRGRHKRRYKATTDSKHSLPVAEHLLQRDFTPREPHTACASCSPLSLPRSILRGCLKSGVHFTLGRLVVDYLQRLGLYFLIAVSGLQLPGC